MNASGTATITTNKKSFHESLTQKNAQMEDQQNHNRNGSSNHHQVLAPEVALAPVTERFLARHSHFQTLGDL